MTGSADAGGLAALGVPADDELLYRTLLNRPCATAAELARATGWDPARVRRRIRALEERGMLTRTGGRPARFAPAPPEPAIEALALRRREEIERARLAAASLTEEFRWARRNGTAFQVLGGPAAIAQRFAQIQDAARDELLILDRPPQAVRGGLRQRGVRHRAIYDHRSLRTPEQLAHSRESARLGEESRILDEVPLRLAIADRRIALVPLGRPAEAAEPPAGTPPSGRPGDALVLSSSALLDGLVALYELLWQRSVPLWPRGGRTVAELSYEDEQLLALSASGLTDRAIARRLGVAQRTVERRMRRIMDLLGARTRFQAGLQAARRGVIGPPE
ncbi:winged helix-turn-helix transcriptional regulator [Streptomyces sp. CAU 1734]|uniref:helix-turn-helix transcriptional regulator n=1 Tax=Streptomyces sp. CAU 1734 TaxID=3140360 RepID=UPI0032614616